ncbi:MAG: ATP-binding protein [Tabrizicola sp.]|nr:ATP-binding protein [Tabrizicola sp.]
MAVFGGPNGDMPLTETMARPFARLIARNNLPAVIDMSDMRKAAWQRLVRDMLDELFTQNRDPLWIVLEEADIFAPQQPREGDSNAVLGEVDRIARRGRAFGFRLISLTQRPARLHKDVLTQLSSLIALGVTSPQDREAIKAWVDGNADRDKAKVVMDSLARLPVGRGWVWVPDLDLLEEAAFPPIATLDNSATPLAGQRRIAPKRLAEVDLSELRAALAVETVDTGSSAELPHHGDQPARQPRGEAVTGRDAGEVAALLRRERDQIERAAYQRGYEDGEKATRDQISLAVTAALATALKGQPPPVASPQEEEQAPRVERHQPMKVTQIKKADTPPPGGKVLSPSAQKVLNVIVSVWPSVITYATAAARAGISRRSSAFRSYRKELLDVGLAVETGKGIEPCGEARDIAGPAPQGIDEWIVRLPPTQSRMLTVLRDTGEGLSREELAGAAGVSLTSSGLGSGLRNLKELGLIVAEDGLFRLAI